MDAYKIIITEGGSGIQRLSDTAFIPPTPDNADCHRFLWDWRQGASVLDIYGNSLSWSGPACKALGLDPAYGDINPDMSP